MRLHEALKKAIQDGVVIHGRRNGQRGRQIRAVYDNESGKYTFEQRLTAFFRYDWLDWSKTPVYFDADMFDEDIWEIVEDDKKQGLSFAEALKKIFKDGGYMQSESDDFPDMKYFYKDDEERYRELMQSHYHPDKNAVAAQISEKMLNATDWVVKKADERAKDKCSGCDGSH